MRLTRTYLVSNQLPKLSRDAGSLARHDGTHACMVASRRSGVIA